MVREIRHADDMTRFTNAPVTDTPPRYYDEKCPAWFGVVPRKGTDPVRWFKYKNCMSIHSGASWEEDGKM